jgi:hypothetical protein
MHSDMSDARMMESQKLLEQPMAKDPTLARAYVKHAWACAWRITYKGNAGGLMQRMVTYARKGVELEPMDADARAPSGVCVSMRIHTLPLILATHLSRLPGLTDILCQGDCEIVFNTHQARATGAVIVQD